MWCKKMPVREIIRLFNEASISKTICQRCELPLYINACTRGKPSNCSHLNFINFWRQCALTLEKFIQSPWLWCHPWWQASCSSPRTPYIWHAYKYHYHLRRVYSYQKTTTHLRVLTIPTDDPNDPQIFGLGWWRSWRSCTGSPRNIIIPYNVQEYEMRALSKSGALT